MSLDDLSDDVQTAYTGLDDALDDEARMELAMLTTALGTDADDLLARAVHQFFQATVDTGRLDFHLRSRYDVTYDEYLSGMTYAEMTGQPETPDNDGRRYQF